MMQKFQKAEQIFVPSNEKTSTMYLKNFIANNYLIPDEDFQRIYEFISNDKGLEEIIFKLPDLIKREVSYDKLQIRFYDEFQKEYLQLEVHISTSMDIITSLKIEYKLEQQLYELFDSGSVDKLLLIMEGQQ